MTRAFAGDRHQVQSLSGPVVGPHLNNQFHLPPLATYLASHDTPSMERSPVARGVHGAAEPSKIERRPR
jgi:hypothetical protein